MDIAIIPWSLSPLVGPLLCPKISKPSIPSDRAGNKPPGFKLVSSAGVCLAAALDRESVR